MFHLPQIPQIPLDVALIAGRAVFLVFCFLLASITFTRWRRASEQTLERFAEQNTALLAQLANIEEGLAASHRRLDALVERVEDDGRRVATPTGSSAPSYQIAIRLARGGAPRDELMASCGLTRQEAELVQRLHAPARQPRLAATG